MELGRFLDLKKTDILDAWIRQVLATYSSEAARIFGREKDRFANPVGYNVRQGLTEMYDALLADPHDPKVGKASVELIKVRAVQEFAPSTAVSFVFLLKTLVRQEGGERELAAADLATVDRAVDTLALQLFDAYMQCRERLFAVRLHEIEHNRHLITDRARCPSRLLRQERPQPAPATAAADGQATEQP